MNNKKILSVLIFSLLFGVEAIGASKKRSEHNDAVGVISVKVSAKNAIEIATSKVAGVVSKIEFEQEGSKSIWDIEVVTAKKKVFDLEIDANTGAILEQKFDNNDEEKHDDDDDDDED